MNPPGTIDVGPHRYRVVVDHDGLLDSDHKAGHCSASRLVIAVDADQEPSQMADTVVHEVVHALLAVSGLDDDIEERVCLALGPGLLGVLQDNPELVRWLAAKR